MHAETSLGFKSNARSKKRTNVNIFMPHNQEVALGPELFGFAAHFESRKRHLLYGIRN